MARRYEVSDLDVEDILPLTENAHVDLGYDGAPSQYQLEQEIVRGLHTNEDGEIGCNHCGNIDLFIREITTKGRRYKCMSCMYNSETKYETLKSRKDITLAKFGLSYECDICGEDIDSFNRDSVLRHLKKHQKENQTLEAEEEPTIEIFDITRQDIKEIAFAYHHGDTHVYGDSNFPHGDRYSRMEEALQNTDWFQTMLDTYGNCFLDWHYNETFELLDRLGAMKKVSVTPRILQHALETAFAKEECEATYPYDLDAETYSHIYDDPDDPNRMWSPDIISPIFPRKGYERPVKEVSDQLHQHLVGREIRMYGPQNISQAKTMKQPMDWWKDVGFSEFQPEGTWGKVTGVSNVNPNRPDVIGIWVTIVSGGSAKHPIGSRVWFHVKDSWFPTSMGTGWHKGDYTGSPARQAYIDKHGIIEWEAETRINKRGSYRTPKELRRQLDAVLGKRVSDPEWDDVNWKDEESLVDKLKDEEWKDDIEWEAESSRPHRVEVSRSTNKQKKLMAIFYDKDGKKVKTTHFGSRGMSDYTKHKDAKRKQRYLARHKNNEKWNKPMTAGALSRWILWGEPSLRKSFSNFKKKFNLQGSMNVTKSAESLSRPWFQNNTGLTNNFTFVGQDSFIPIWNTVFFADKLSEILDVPIESMVMDDTVAIKIGDNETLDSIGVIAADTINEYVL
mgnify:FL=1|tara:strand:- start:5557 stop:7581 length:2025 start_codon:yes stop_codon:yes gene_type:complete